MKRMKTTLAIVLLIGLLSLQQKLDAQWNTITGLEAEVIVHGGNGFGSTNTIIRRFTTVDLTVGTAISYADDVVYGASFRINVPGVYAISYTDQRIDTAYSGYLYYIEVDHSPVQSTVSTITSGATFTSIATNSPTIIGTNNVTLLLDAGDVVRPWWFGNFGGTYNDLQAKFIITKVK